MFQEMRRKNQQLTQAQTQALLERGSAGVLSLMGEQGYPYGVPVSYLYDQGRLYFHTARQGAKVEALARSPKASFCLIAADQVDPDRYTTHYASVIAFGEVRVLQDPDRIRQVMERLGAKYCPGRQEGVRREIQESAGHYLVLEMEIRHLTGKKAK